MRIFEKLYFNVNEKVFFELFRNPDQGFGFSATFHRKWLTEIQIETFDFLIRCQKKKLLGTVNLVFKTDVIGELQEMNRSVEKIEFKNDEYTISNTY